jgi:hypothetical protein
MSALALLLMLLTVGLLIAPSAFHRISQKAKAQGECTAFTGWFAALALLPFAVALGLDQRSDAKPSRNDIRSLLPVRRKP